MGRLSVVATGRQKKLKRINTLIEDVKRNGNLTGIGKPEALKGNLQGFYSRRIDSEHRLVYRMTSEQVEIHQCRYHYANGKFSYQTHRSQVWNVMMLGFSFFSTGIIPRS